MFEKYILAIDQSTSGTKALLFNGKGDLVERCDLSHRQIINDKGWVEHDLKEIYNNTIEAVKQLIEKSGIDKTKIYGVGISNQRETAAVWDKTTGEPIYNAIVWQCTRGEAICNRISQRGKSDMIKAATGLPLSPYFSGAKIAWVLENVDTTDREICAGTIDSWLVFKLTGNFKTDYSNASRTQLFDIIKLKWSDDVCGEFGINTAFLPEVCYSNSCFGYTDFEGFFDKKIPIHCVMGDSHAALFGQGCLDPGMIKTTYGTGSSVVMNTGKEPIWSGKGVVTSIAWGMSGNVNYILEGNINYTGAVIKWIVDDLGLIDSPNDTSRYAEEAKTDDETYLVPAFTGLGAPYFNSEAKAIISGMTRTTGKAEIVKAALESIAYQIADIVEIMLEATTDIEADSIRVDGGPTRNKYLMQFQSNILNLPVLVPLVEELSGLGVAYATGIAMQIYDYDEVFSQVERKRVTPTMELDMLIKKRNGWKEAVRLVLR